LERVGDLDQSQIDGGCCGVLRLFLLVQHLVKVMGKQDGALRVSIGKGEKLVHSAAGVQAVGSKEGFDVVGSFAQRQSRDLERTGCP